MEYLIHQIQNEKIDDLMKFIRLHWSHNHILGNNRDFFEYQHREGDKINYIVAEKDDNIDAVLGFIPYGKDNRDVMLALWKSISEDDAFLGVKLLEYLKREMGCRRISCCGINEKTFGIYRFLGYYVGQLKQYYLLQDKNEYQVAQINKKTERNYCENEIQYSLNEIRNFGDLQDRFSFDKYREGKPNPYKESWYINKRYFQHPIYRYCIWGIEDRNGNTDCLLVGREQRFNGTKVLRIVDCIGKTENIRFLSKGLKKLLYEREYEYIDFYEYGIPDNVMLQAGFIENDNIGNIIPNYFEPFEAKNVVINFCTEDKDGFVIFKGDGDQDRPNFWKQ